MRSARPPDLSPLHLIARLDGGRLAVILTDCRSVSRHASGGFDPAAAARLADLALAHVGNASQRRAHMEAAAALHRLLFPGAVGEFLRQSPPRALTLQLEPGLDFLPWEQAGDGVECVGEKFRLSRCLLFDDDLGSPISTGAPRHGRLSVLRLVPDASAASTTSAHRCAAEAPAGPTLSEAADTDQVQLQVLPRAALTAETAAAHMLRHDLIEFATADSALTLLALQPAAWPRLPRLFVIPAAPEEPPLRLIRTLGALGAAVLVVPAPVPANPATDAERAWFDALTAALAAGCFVGEAVRQLRCAHQHLAHLPPLRLYCAAEFSLIDAEARVGESDHLRQITIVCFDLVDSSGWLQRLGGELYGELLSSFHERCGAVLRRHGGAVEEPQGDGGMSFFGHPVAHEGAAEQAVAAALEIIEAVAPLQLALRVGIATGRVAVKSGQPIGVAVHLAARLQAAAVPGTVLVSAATRALVLHRFALESLPAALTLKGIEGPQAVYRVSSDRTGHRLDTLPRLTPFVGREAELAALDQEWKAACQSGTRAVLVTGEAGIGKSRLLREFRLLQRRRRQGTIEFRCRPDSRDSAFQVVIDTAERQLGFHPHDAAAVRLEKIIERLPAGMARAESVPLIASLLAVPYEHRYCALAGTAERLRERTLATLVEWCRLAAQTAPVCLLLEDAHWIDPSTREFISQILALPGSLPLLVVITRRGETDAGWRPDAVDRRIELRGLPPAAARGLIEKACGELSLPARVVRQLSARADGVPLFLEESARMAVELGAAHVDDLPLPQQDVPATLQDLLMARLDRLGSAKAVAQLGAVLGREFPVALLASVFEHDGRPIDAGQLAAQLGLIEQSGLMTSSGSLGERRCAFKHALVRDIAYQSLWERDRQRLHRAVAAVLARHWPELTGRQPELLAHHQAEAGLAAEALTQWEAAARHAASRSAHDEAINHLHRALGLLADQADSPARDRIELRLQLLLASRYIATEGYGADRVERVYVRAAALCQALGDTAALLKVELGLEGYHFMRGDFPRAHQNAARAVAMAERSADVMPRLQANWAEAHILFHEGNALAAVDLMDRCLAGYRPEQHRRGAVQDPGVMCLCYSAWAQWELGHPDDAMRRIRRVLDLARTLDHKFSLGEAYGFAANVHRYRGELQEALACVDQCIAICEDGGFAVWLAHAHVIRGRLLCEPGDAGGLEPGSDALAARLAAGLAEMAEGYAMWLRTGAVVSRPFYLALQAEGLARAGRVADGLRLLDQALQIAQQHGERYYEAEIRRLIAELTLQRGGAGDDSATAERWLLGAHALAVAQRKRGFALRSATNLARLWAKDGREPEAVALLEPALAGFTEGHGTHDLREARRVLEGLKSEYRAVA